MKGYFTAVSSFFDFLVEYEYAQLNPVVSFRRRYIRQFKEQERNPTQLIDIEDFENLTNALDPKEPYKSAVTICGLNGLRNGEYPPMDVGHFHFTHPLKIFEIPEHPKRTYFYGFMAPQTERIVKEYLRGRMKGHHSMPGPSMPAFVGVQSGKRVDEGRVLIRVQSVAEELGFHDPKPNASSLKKFNMKCLRHFFVTFLLEYGLPEEYMTILRGDSGGKFYKYNHQSMRRVCEEYQKAVSKMGLKI